jgi:hypothetical protein
MPTREAAREPSAVMAGSPADRTADVDMFGIRLAPFDHRAASK